MGHKKQSSICFGISCQKSSISLHTDWILKVRLQVGLKYLGWVGVTWPALPKVNHSAET